MTNRMLTVTTRAIVLIVTFSFGYLAGNLNRPTEIEPNNKLSVKDMEHAFGDVAPSLHALDKLEPQEPMAMSLGGLVAGLEKKVAKDPGNIDQQLLLAQTYNELGNREKSIKLLRSLHKKSSNNPQVSMTLATVLMKSSDEKELKEASIIFDMAIKQSPEVERTARMYQDEIKDKLKELSK